MCRPEGNERSDYICRLNGDLLQESASVVSRGEIIDDVSVLYMNVSCVVFQERT